MKKRIFRVLAPALTVLFLVLCASPAFATLPSSLDPNSSYSGWALMAGKGHMGSKNCTYSFYDAETKAAYESYFNTGKALWGSAINMTYRETGAKGYVMFDTNPYATILAQVDNYTVDNNDHCTGYRIRIFSNIFDYPQGSETSAQAEVRKGKVLAHEIGHVYGLYEAPSDKTGQIMHTNVKHSSAVTSSDLAGMSVVTHSHTHSSSTAFTYVNTRNSSYHKHRCKTCKAYFGQSSHVWVIGGKTGNNYHSGKYHYFEYSRNCSKCNRSSPIYQSVPCSGPPCNFTTSIGFIKGHSAHASPRLPL